MLPFGRVRASGNKLPRLQKHCSTFVRTLVMPLDANLQSKLTIWISLFLNEAWVAIPSVPADCGGESMEMPHLPVAGVMDDQTFPQTPFAVNWL